MKKRTLSLAVILLLSGVLLNCQRRAFVRKGPSPITDVEGKTYYTQVGMWVEMKEHETTNYKKGWFLPVNSKVKILSTSSSSIKVRVENNSKKFTIVNVRDHTRKGIKQIFERYFGKGKVDLSQFSKTNRDYIRNGALRKGMSKKAALLARGYPPTHKTPSTNKDTWTYWTSRFDQMKVIFEGDEIKQMKD